MEQTLDHRELARRANDLIAVFNPTTEDFVVLWDGYKNVIPNCNKDIGHGPGVRVVPRYIAENYVTKMTDQIILKKAKIAVESENKERVEKRKMKAMDAWEEQLVFERPLMVDNEDLRREILPTLWKGVVEQFGMDDVVTAPEKVDFRPIDERLLEELDRPYQAPAQTLSAHEDAISEVAE